MKFAMLIMIQEINFVLYYRKDYLFGRIQSTHTQSKLLAIVNSEDFYYLSQMISYLP